MLTSLRYYANSWIAQLLMGILVLSFSVWGVADVFTGFRSDDIARVGSVDLTAADFQRSYDIQIRAMSQQLGQAITNDQARAAGVPQQVLDQLVSTATLDDAAAGMGLGLSNGTLADKITHDPEFFGSSGAFDRGYLNQLIQQQGLDENTFVSKRRSDYVRSQIVAAFVAGSAAPDSYLRAVNQYQGEQRDVSYLALSAPAATAIADPSDADLATYYAAHKSDWATPELRTIRYFRVSPAEVAQADTVSDADAKTRYDAQPDRWATKETRDVQQIVFKDKADADAAAAEIAGGKTFDDLLAERKMTAADADLGFAEKDKMADAAIANAAFALAQGVPSAIIDGQFGPAIVRTVAIKPAVVTTFDQAKDDIKKEIANEKAVTEINTMHDAIEDARAGGATLADAAAKYGLKVVTLPPIDAKGKDIDGNDVPDSPGPTVLTAAFQSDVGLQNDPVQPDDSSYVWYEVTAKADPRDRTLADVHDKVVAAWKDAERQKKLDATADSIKTQLDDKVDIAKIASDLGLQVAQAAKLTRSTPPTGQLSAPAVSAAFDGPVGTAAVADGALPYTKIALVVDNISEPPFDPKAPQLAQTKTGLDSQFVNDLLALYVGELGTRTPVKYNDVALQQLFSGSDTTETN